MIPAFVEKHDIIMTWDHEGTIIYNNTKRWERSIEVLRHEYPEPPLDARSLPPPSFNAPPTGPLQPVGPAPVIRHQDFLNGEWREFGIIDPEVTTSQILLACTCGQAWAVKANWSLDAQTLNGTGGPKETYFRMFARQGSNLHSNVSMKVYANQPCFVTWTTDLDGYGRGLVIFPIEMSVPDGKPCEFRCSWVPFR